MAKRQKLVLFDGHALLHRGFHALPFLSTKAGLPTNGVYGFTTMMLKALAEIKPDYVAVGWDMPGPTFRHKMYKDYKGTRAPLDPNLVPQIALTKDLIESFNIPLVEKPGYEADDVIGTLAKQHEKDVDIVIVTGDMDELQLVDAHTRVYTMRQGFTDTVLYDEPAVEAKYGVSPEQLVVFKALKGDASDNIPGVEGIGDKTASQLTSSYKNLDGIYENLAKIKPPIAQKLKAGRQAAYLSLKLAQIKTDLKLKFDLNQAKLEGYDRDKVYKLFTKLEFKSLLAKLPNSRLAAVGSPAQSASATAHQGRRHLKNTKYHLIDNQKDLDKLVRELALRPAFAFDTETDSLDFINANLVGLSVSFKKAEAYYIPVGHKEGQQLPITSVLEKLKPILENPKIGKVGHNIKFDYQIMKRYEIKLGPIIFDTMVAAFLVNPIVRALTLADLAFNELGLSMIPIEELIGPKGKAQKTFDKTPIADAVIYAAEDADMSWRLYQELDKQLAKLPKVRKLAGEMEWPLVAVLGDMEFSGVSLNTDFLRHFAKEIDAKLALTEADIWKMSGMKFNISSTKQLKEVLFDKLKIQSTELKKIKTGISTAAKELEKLRGMHPIIELIFEYREVVKLKTTYVDALPALVNPTTGKIHTSYNQTIAQTGRLSSTNPNLQNIPIRTPLGARVREAFVAGAGNVFVSADYSQIEMRLAAALSNDKPMIETFKKGADIHALTAAELFEVDPKNVSKDQRYAAKTINFGILYGMNPHGLSVATGLEHAQAKDFIDYYFQIRQGLANYIEKLRKQAHRLGYTETIFGRRRPCPDVHSNNFVIRSAAERAAINMPFQGTQADMIKLAMIDIAKKLPDGANIILQIHDELIVECTESLADKVGQIMKESMERVHKFKVPIVVDISKGKSWGDL